MLEIRGGRLTSAHSARTDLERDFWNYCHTDRNRLQAAVPEDHRIFLEGMADTFRFGDYLFVHAGVRPGVAIEDCGPKLGLDGVDNGRIWFDHVRVPRENLIGKVFAVYWPPRRISLR